MFILYQISREMRERFKLVLPVNSVNRFFCFCLDSVCIYRRLTNVMFSFEAHLFSLFYYRFEKNKSFSFQSAIFDISDYLLHSRLRFEKSILSWAFHFFIFSVSYKHTYTRHLPSFRFCPPFSKDSSCVDSSLVQFFLFQRFPLWFGRRFSIFGSSVPLLNLAPPFPHLVKKNIQRIHFRTNTSTICLLPHAFH